MRRILVATDGSEMASRAVEFAARLAASEHCALKVLNVVDYQDPPTLPVVEFSRMEHASPGDMLTAWAEQTVQSAVNRARTLGVAAVETELQSGEVAAAILETAARDRADVIVVGKRGLGRVKGALIGSVSQKVMSAAGCVVIVVP